MGFRALPDEALEARWEEAKRRAAQDAGAGYDGRLARHELVHLRFVNEKLRGYDDLTE